MIQTDYLHSVFYSTTFQNKIDNAIMIMSSFDKENPFEAIAFTGISGAAFAFPLAYLLSKSLICIRKANSSTHCSLSIEGHVDCTSYIIVDDFISTGATINLITTSIEKEFHHTNTYCNRNYPKFVAVFLYDEPKLDYVMKLTNNKFPIFKV